MESGFSSSLGAGQTDVWLVSLADPAIEALEDAYGALLDPGETAKAASFVFARDRRTYRVAHALVRTVLSRYVPFTPGAWRFGENGHGRPFVLWPQSGGDAPVVHPDLRFNLSHTRGLVACAVTLGRAVGLDVERVDDAVDVGAVAAYSLARREVDALATLPPEARVERFFAYWTLKEAFIKAKGMGLAFPLDQFAFDLEERSAVSISFAPQLDEDPARWRFLRHAPSREHRLALCLELAGDAEEVRIWRGVPLRQMHPVAKLSLDPVLRASHGLAQRSDPSSA